MTAPEDASRTLIETVLARATDQLRGELERLVRQARASEAAQQADAVRAARQEAEAAAHAFATEAIAADRQGADQRLADAVAAARVDEREAFAAYMAGLLEDVSALERAGSLPETLAVLLDRAAPRAGRAALLVVRGSRLHAWKWRGFDTDEVGAVEGAVDESRPIAEAFRRNGPQATAGAIAIPVRVGGVAVAVLYGDPGDPQHSPARPAWAPALQVLAAYAGRVLEALTLGRLTQLRAGGRASARASQPHVDEEAARRYARLVVAEIKLYHGGAVEEGRRDGDLLRRLRPQIERAQQLYTERVSAAVRARTSFFEDELVRTLADGNAALLGHSR